MESYRQQVIKEIFLAVVDLAPDERASYLDEHCPDPEIRDEVEALLAHHDQKTPSLLSGGPVGRQGGIEGVEEEELPESFRLDEFRILRKIGSGGMATVYLAEDTSLRRRVAIKVLPVLESLQPNRVTRFEREATAVAGLHHPNIVAVYRTGQAAGIRYLVMEYVEGVTLAFDLARRRAKSGDTGTRTTLADARQTARLIASVADALDHAHRNRVIHRDVKPSNILIGSDGQPRLADFGIAKTLEDDTITEPGVVPGTYRYMSPEQAAALSSKIDGRSDVFSLGSVLYEALTLEPAFSGNSRQEVIYQIIARVPSGPRIVSRAVPKDLDTICQKAMEKDPRDRYPTAGHMGADLRAFLNGDPIMARRASVVRKSRQWLRRHRMAASFAVIGVLIAAVAGMTIKEGQRRAAAACRLSVTSQTSGADVLLIEFPDGSDTPGPHRYLGKTPIANALMSTGRFRVAVMADDGRFVEADFRMFDPGEILNLDLQLFHTDDVVTDMIQIPGGTYALGRAPGGPFQDPRSTRLEPFFVDQFEVSNADYLAFMKATGADPPFYWVEDAGRDFLERPVVTLFPEQMEAYAAWRGKRLPTASEWEAVWAGVDGRRFPWGESPPLSWPQVPTLDIISARDPHDVTRLQEQYQRHTTAVRSAQHLSSAEGVYHLVGNVEEMTSSWDLATGRVVITKGGVWADHPSYTTAWGAPGRPGDSCSFLVGFRCVRTAAVDHLNTNNDKESR